MFRIFDDITETTLKEMASWLDELKDNTRHRIEICSHGGLVFYGNAVWQKMLQAQSRGIKFDCAVYGIAASSAADIVLCCDYISIARNASIMIHSAFGGESQKDRGVEIANNAQLAIIHKRLPKYTSKELEKDRWFEADEALKIGLVDSIFDDIISTTAKLAAKLVAKWRGVMDEEKKEEIVEEKKEEVTEEKPGPTVEDLLEQLVERVAKIEERVAAMESGEEDPKAECGDDNRKNARLNAIQQKINSICMPATPKPAVKMVTPEQELKAYKEKHPNIEKYINEK